MNITNQTLKCWHVGRAYGTVIYFEMKDKIFEPILSLHIGSVRLWVNADFWKINQTGELRFDAETLSDEDVPALNKLFSGKALTEIRDDNDFLTVIFEDIEMVIGKDSDNDIDEDLVTLSFTGKKSDLAES